MALAAAVKGGRRPAQIVTWTRGDGAAEDLTGATLTGIIRNRSTAVGRAIVGTLTVTDATAGAFRWDYAAADVADSGQFDVQFSAAYVSGQTPAKTFVTRWEVKEALAVTA